MTRCDCCDLPAESCGREAERQARREAAAERERLLAVGFRPAAHVGRCADCGDSVEVGDPIAPARSRDGWRGACCT